MLKCGALDMAFPWRAAIGRRVAKPSGGVNLSRAQARGSISDCADFGAY
jgi:hypothetical protein